MATLQELKGLMKDSDLNEKVAAALIIAVQAVLDGTPTADQQKYAAAVFANPVAEAKKAQASVLASNASATVAQITGATDASIQTNVNDVIDTLAVAYNAGV